MNDENMLMKLGVLISKTDGQVSVRAAFTELPANLDWFKVDRYEDSTQLEFDALEWGHQICERLSILRVLGKIAPPSSTEIQREPLLLDLRISKLLANPLRLHSDCLSVSNDISPVRTKGDSDEDLSKRSVHGVFSELMGLSPVPVEKKLSVEQQYLVYSVAQRPILDNVAEVEVDLNASDVTIRKTFDQWLSAQRNKAETNQKKIKATASKFKQWQGNKILAYADLLLWQKWSGSKISQEKLIELLFPNDSRQLLEHPLRRTEEDYNAVFSDESARLLLTEGGRPYLGINILVREQVLLRSVVDYCGDIFLMSQCRGSWSQRYYLSF